MLIRSAGSPSARAFRQRSTSSPARSARGCGGIAGQMEAEALQPDRSPARTAPVQRGRRVSAASMPKRLCGCGGRQPAQQQPRRAHRTGQREGDQQVQFVERVHGDQTAVQEGQPQQFVALGRSGDDDVLAAHPVSEGARAAPRYWPRRRRPRGRRSARIHTAALLAFLRVVHPPLDTGVAQCGAEGGEVGVEPVREQEVEGTAEGVGQLVQQTAVQHPVGVRVGVGGQGRHGRGRRSRSLPQRHLHSQALVEGELGEAVAQRDIGDDESAVVGEDAFLSRAAARGDTGDDGRELGVDGRAIPRSRRPCRCR